VQKAIDDRRRLEQVKAAEGYIIRDRLVNHQAELVNTIGTILQRLGLPSMDEPIVIECQVNPVEKDDLSYGRLLREHLDNATFSKLAKWETTYAKHLAARRSFHEKLQQLVKEKTGLEVFTGNQKPPCLHLNSLVPVFRFALAMMLASLTAKSSSKAIFTPDLDGEICADLKMGNVRLRNCIIAECPGEEKVYFNKIIEAMTELLNSPAGNVVILSARELMAASSEVRTPLKELEILGMVPGRCRICRRLGLS
jgi:hypothetical protein